MGGIERRNPMITIDPDTIQHSSARRAVPTSKYSGVSWKIYNNKWQAQLKVKQKMYYGGLHDNEEQAAMSVNLLCDKCEIERKNLAINIQTETVQEVQNHTSLYSGVSWQNDAKKWKAELMHKRKKYYGGLFENEEHAAMKINLLCDKYGIKRKNPTIIIDPDAMQHFGTRREVPPNSTSKYSGVSWKRYTMEVYFIMKYKLQ